MDLVNSLPRRGWQQLSRHSTVDQQMLKLVEEVGEAAGALIGLRGANPRKGITHDGNDVAMELADVAWTAMIAIEAMGRSAEKYMEICALKIETRLKELQ